MPRPIQWVRISSEKERYQRENTNPEGAVPTSSAKSHTIRTDSQATNTVLVSGKHTYTLTLERVPDVTCPVIISTK